MAEVLREDFGGATSGTAVSATNSAFDSSGGTGTFTFSSTELVSGLGQSTRFVCSAQFGYLQKTGLSAATYYARVFLQIDSMPSSNVQLIIFRVSTANGGGIRLTTTGALALLNGTTAVATTTTTLSANTPYRIEHDVTGTTQTLRLYSANGTTPLETISGAAPGGTMTAWRLGPNQSVTLSGYFDSAVLNDANTPGPENLSTNYTGSAAFSGTGTLTASGAPGLSGGNASFSGVGSLSAGAAGSTSFSGTATFGGSGSLVANQQGMAGAGSASFSGSGTITAAASTGVRTGKAKVWDGTAWVARLVKTWSGTAWVIHPVKVWTGSVWTVAK